MSKKTKKIIAWSLVFIWFVFIFIMSNMNNDDSNNKSINTLNKVVETTVNTTSELGITNEISTEEVQEIAIELNWPFRKCMHSFVYCILILLTLNAIRYSNLKTYQFYLDGFLISFFYSIFDEYHQTFVNGRNGQITDVLIDSIGIILGILIYYFITKIKKST